MTKQLDTSGYTGTSKWFRYSLLPGYTYTEGVQYVAEAAEAYWLLDVIFSYQHEAKVKAQEFQVWTLQKTADDAAVVTMTDGNSKVPIVTQEIPFTDFPQNQMIMWLTDKVLLLPSEY